jgi:hypothetical protein
MRRSWRTTYFNSKNIEDNRMNNIIHAPCLALLDPGSLNVGSCGKSISLLRGAAILGGWPTRNWSLQEFLVTWLRRLGISIKNWF